MLPIPVTNVLPIEILTYILRVATAIPSCYLLQGIYVPFHNVPGENILPENRATLSKVEEESWSTKLSVTLVCKSWRWLTLEYLYEDLYVGEHIDRILEGFEKSEREYPGKGSGRLVRRVTLSAWRPGIKSATLAEVLRWCPNVEILVKSDDDTFPTPTSDVELSSIKRFDWRFTRYSHLERGLHWQNTDQGLDFYRNIVMRAHNLQYLTVAIRYPMSRCSVFPPQAINAHNLTTLRVQHIGPIIRSEIEGWDCPNLIHIITDSSLMWDTHSSLFGPRTEVVELIKDEILHSLSALGVVARCPNLRELNYHVEYAQFPSAPIFNNSLEYVRLHAGRNYMIDATDTWDLLEDQISVFTGGSFPMLRAIALYGEWGEIVKDPSFRHLKNSLHAKGCVVEYPPGVPLNLVI